MIGAEARIAPFSLLLPVYRNDDPEQFMSAFTSSVQAQSVRPDEVVIVQDGQVPEMLSAAIAEAISSSPVHTQHVRIPDNVGLAKALTIGLAACSHDLVARMDADDVSLPNRFERQIAAMESGLDLVGTAMLEFAEDSEVVLGKRTPPVGANTIARYARFHDPFHHPTVMYRKTAVEAAGGYQDIGLMEDYWLFARMIHAGARVNNIPDALLMYRVGAGAYARRGGAAQFSAEVRLQCALRRIRFTSRLQFVRNLTVRGLYRYVPVGIRKRLYRRLIAKGFHSSR